MGELVVESYDASVISQCRPGDTLRLWTKPGLPLIYAYTPRSVGGTGRALTLSKTKNAELAAILDEGLPVWLEVGAADGSIFTITAKFKSRATVDDEFDARSAEHRRELSAPYHPRKQFRVTARTRGPLPFSVSDVIYVVPGTIDVYASMPNVTPQLACSRLDQWMYVSGRNRDRFVRALLTGLTPTISIERVELIAKIVGDEYPKKVEAFDAEAIVTFD